MIFLGSGDTAKVYQIADGRVLKLYHLGEYSSREYQACKYVGEMTPFAPQVFNEVVIGDKQGFEMQALYGELLVNVIDESSDMTYYAELMAKHHKELHEWDSCELKLPSLKEGLIRYVGGLKHIDDSFKTWGLDLLDGLEDGNSLLHGDYMPYNLMYLDGKLKSMDWSDAMIGPAVADISRSLYFIIDPHDFKEAKYTLESNNFIKAYLFGYYGNETPMVTIQKWLIINVIIELDELIAAEVSNDFTIRLNDYLKHNRDVMGSDYLFE